MVAGGDGVDLAAQVALGVEGAGGDFGQAGGGLFGDTGFADLGGGRGLGVTVDIPCQRGAGEPAQED